MPEYGVILLNLGAPDSVKSVEPFLYNLFSDPDIFKFPLPRITQRFFARIVSKFRAKYVAKHYLEIGGRSPLLSYTHLQAKRLEKKLEPQLSCRVYIGMRYWHPMIDEALQKAIQEGVKKIILLPLYPQFSTTTTGSSLNEFNRISRKLNLRGIKVYTIKSYPENELYVRAVSERVEESLKKFSPGDFKNFAILFSAHGLPVRFIENGDPYLNEVKCSVDAILNYLRAKSENREVYKKATAILSFQSKVGLVKWLKPSTTEAVKKLAKEGIENLLVVPISFASDNVETLYELGIRLREVALKSGIKKFFVAEALNDSDTFIEALKNIVLEVVRNET